MIEGLLIAAGKSQRSGEKYKMTLDFGGRTLIEKSLASMAPFCAKIIVVTGYKARELGVILQKYPKIEIIFNPAYEEGMFSSIKVGLKQIRSERFFFLPGDCPFVAPTVYQKLLAVDSEIVLPTFHALPGHPVLFKKTVIEKILAGSSYYNLREFITDHQPAYEAVDCQGILWDIDTMADYREALRFWKSLES
ncbi:MAG TPA: NTP transferase domain-containing protein [Desulfitobacteriaceae bacterium]|nr:NTP transferase domain-containing protein [Desulfitobacteriaceae bacterium]